MAAILSLPQCVEAIIVNAMCLQGPQWCLTPRYTFLLWWSRSCYCPGTPMVSHPEVYLSLVAISILLLSRDPNGVSPRGIPFSCGDLDPVIVQGPQWCLTPRYTFLLWWSRSCDCPGTPMVSHLEVYLFSCGDLDPVIVQGPQWCLTPRYTFLLWWSRSCDCPGTPMVSHLEVYLSLVAISILLLSRDPNGVSPRGIPFSCGDLDPVIVQGPQWCLTPRYTFLLWRSRSCYCPGTPMVSHPEVYLSLVVISILLLYSFILVYQTAHFILQPFWCPDKHCQIKRKVTKCKHIYIYMCVCVRYDIKARRQLACVQNGITQLGDCCHVSIRQSSSLCNAILNTCPCLLAIQIYVNLHILLK